MQTKTIVMMKKDLLDGQGSIEVLGRTPSGMLLPQGVWVDHYPYDRFSVEPGGAGWSLSHTLSVE